MFRIPERFARDAFEAADPKVKSHDQIDDFESETENYSVTKRKMRAMRSCGAIAEKGG